MKYKLWLTVLTAIMMACGACSVVSEKDNPLEVLNKAREAQKNAKSYRAQLTISYPDHQVVATLECVNPNRYHIVDGNSEFILIGENIYSRSGPNWNRVSYGHAKILAFSPFSPITPQKYVKEEIKFVGKVEFDGQQTLVYEDIREHSKIWISPMDALPRKVEDEFWGGGEVAVNTRTVIYSDYNSGIKIEPPL